MSTSSTTPEAGQQSEPLSVEEAAALLGKPEAIRRSVAVKGSSATTDLTTEPQLADDDIAARFRNDTAKHVMTVLHDEGLYRHLRFAQPKPASSMYWFDIITWPGALHLRGDIGDSYTFNRLSDMFEFFRSRSGDINPHYWSEKLDGHRDSAKVYSEDSFKQIVTELFVDAVRYSDAPRGLGKAVREEILNRDLTVESEARDLLEGFEYEGFTFGETWEYSFRDYDWSFLWACHAIVSGIAQYDAAKAAATEAVAA